MRLARLTAKEAATAQPVGLGDTPELQRADEDLAARDGYGLVGIFAAKIGEMARRYEDGHRPDFANAALVELFAWCLARPARGSGATPRGGPPSGRSE